LLCVAAESILNSMSSVSRLLQSIDHGDPQAASQLLPLVYDELRRLAKHKMARERPGLTLGATALVHEAYLRLVSDGAQFDNRGHFFVAAAEAMRRILVENARRKLRQRHGGGRRRVELAECEAAAASDPGELLAMDEALTQLAADDPPAAELAKLRFYAGLSVEQAAEALGLSRATAYRHWTYARAQLRCALWEEERPSQP
jgi:RNA polymerase sigma factor (TIGR02999 family)